MDNKKHIVNLESFRDMLHICLRVHGQSFNEPPFKEEILAFIGFLGHNEAIRTLTNVEHKNTKKSNEMYYPRFTKVIIHHFMSKDPSIPRRNKFGAPLPIELANDEIKNSNAYKEYYEIATRAAPLKPKASARRTRTKASKAKCLSALSEVAMTEAQQLKLVTKRSMQQTYISQASGSGADERISSIPGVPYAPTNESEEELSWNSNDDEGADNEGKDGDDDEEDEVVRDDDEDDEEEEDLGLNVGGEERHVEEEEEDELYRDVNINQGRGLQASLEVEDSYVTLTLVNPDGQQQSSSVSSQFVTIMLNLTLDVGMESIFETTSQLDVQTPTSVAPLPMSAPTMTPSTIATITTTSQAPILPTTVSSNIIQNLPNFGSLFRFDDILRSLEANFSEPMQTNQFAGAVFAILGIIQRYMDQRMNKVVKVAVQVQSDHLRDEAQRENEEFLKTAVNEQLKAEVLTRSSHSSKTSYAIAADLLEMELKKILIEKIEGNKSIQRSDEQRNLYKALVEAYKSDKIILDTYGETRRKGASVSKRSNRNCYKERWQWHSYKHLDWITVRRDDDKLYKFKEDDFKRLHIQDIEDMLLLLVQGKLTNLTVEERFAFKVSLRMFTRSIVIQRHVEDLQLGVRSYQKKLNLTKLDSNRSDLKRKEAYTTYSNPQGFIYQNKDKRNRLMRIDELHKFSDRTLTDVRTALDDRLKEIRMQYLPQSIWRKTDKDNAAAMIQAIDKRLKTRRIMRSLERFVRGRLYDGDFRMLQRTI
nr:hypothetical protein [Tanacetum cinerariifolium]